MLRTLLWRIALPTLLIAAAVVWLVMPLADRAVAGWFRTDLEARAALVAAAIALPLGERMDAGDLPGIDAYLAQATAPGQVRALLVCRPDGALVRASRATPPELGCALAVLQPADGHRVRTADGLLHVSSVAATTPGGQALRLLVGQDASWIAARLGRVRDHALAVAVAAAMALAAVSGTAGWLVIRGWAARLVHSIRERRVRGSVAPTPHSAAPVLAQVDDALRELERQQRLEIESHENWTPEALQHLVREQMGSPEIVVISNREPWSHERTPAGGIAVQAPASGMVTALEPVMRACSGTWVAHGSGSADRLVVDARDRVRVPPERPVYTLRRVWLGEAEEQGYYYGFANEGLWPLCHLAYVRPAFRPGDWQHYVTVNERFAEAAVAETASDEPVFLVQDYHFAMLPQALRRRRPGATIALFWHIPWPNAEAFGVCPWRVELLESMLMADVLGFHTRWHCQNFLASVDRFVECQIDRDTMTVTIRGHVCRVAAYPISIDWPPPTLEQVAPVDACGQAVRERLGLPANLRLGVGVERWDFTKGILERFLALELLFERWPHWIGRLTFVQVAAPTRSKLPAYQRLQQETRETLERVVARFTAAPGAPPGWKPIVLVDEHQDAGALFELYRAADFCLVNSLHDGMNLVAKEFVAARDDEDGVLILSRMAGASRELAEALQVNPFDVEETARAIDTALGMPREERALRMRLMRGTVKEFNVYRWAGRMLTDLARARQRQALAKHVQARDGERRAGG